MAIWYPIAVANKYQIDRAARFVKSHSLLQSRSTTQTEDLPLILVNMSGMNGNSVSRCSNTNERMKFLFYGLETLPVELLFSECARIGSCEVDSWIPREVVPVKFSGANSLQLSSEGFTFHQTKEKQPLKFLLLPSSTTWQNQVLLFLSDESDNTQTKYLVEAPRSPPGHSTTTSKYGWCILAEDWSLEPRGARFVVSRIVGHTVFLHFDCPLRLSRSTTEDPKISEQRLSDVSIALPADSRQVFIIEKSPTPQDLGMSRPQNPEQYSDRLIVISQTLWWGLSYLERQLMEMFLPETISNHIYFFYAWSFVSYQQLQWVEHVLHAFVHHAWVETYQPTWRSNGPWKWFWKLSNYEPPIPFKTMNKCICTLVFFFSLLQNQYSATMSVSLYWYAIYPKKELVNMYVTALVWKCVFRILGW
jgi:hypothetical protein